MEKIILDSLETHEMIYRLIFFILIFVLLLVVELLMPRRQPTTEKSGRMVSNLALVGINTLILRVFLKTLAVDIALLSQLNSWGLFNNIFLPLWLQIVLTVVVLDLVIYLQHVIFHKIPLLWRVHMVHHTDLDLDVSTGVRFHPLEMIISMIVKMFAVGLLGAPVAGVIIFEIALNAMSMFSHSNIRILNDVDNVIRKLFITPDMHRVHHSVIKEETNSNFGFNLSIWDRIFNTYKAIPQEGHQGMTIGLEQYRDEKTLNMIYLIAMPFRAVK